MAAGTLIRTSVPAPRALGDQLARRSDGHTYEHGAIAYVLHCGDGRSPMTREALRRDVYPNIELRGRPEPAAALLRAVRAALVA